MRRLPRRLALWGGAAAIAGGGFAFMASNNVLVSSAGEGAGAVSGYTVSNIRYGITFPGAATCGGNTACQNTYGRNHPQNGNHTNTSYTNVTFRLTTKSTTPNATTKPTNVVVYPEGTGGSTPWGSDQCTSSNWHTTGTGYGQGTFTCTFRPIVGSFTLRKLDVEANQ